MSFSNNSRNVANLLRFQPLEPIRPTNQQRINTIQPPSRQRQEIPILDVFTPEQNISEKRNSRRIAPLSSGGNNRNEDLSRGSRNPNNDMEFQALKIRLDQIIKYYDERNSNLETKLMVRLNELQNFVMKEVPKIDNTIMISSDIAGFKEALKQVRRQQEIQFNEINSIKAITRERNNAESLVAQNAKDKQKITVLFMQMVRLGDTIQKMNDQVGSSARLYQSRIQDLQQKLANSQKNLSIISQRTSSGTQVLNEFGDKLMNRLQSAESNLLILGKQQIKQRQVMNSITSQNQRIGQDINTMILNMQTDFQNKLENRMNEQLNRLMNEHQERIRAQQEIRKNLDIMERIHQQKQQSDKLQNKARLNDMDVAVRNEFLKKQESIKGLQMGMEQQFRTLMNELQMEAGKRKEQEAAFRFEIKKVQESLRKEYDLYKNHQSQLMDTITGLIKTEVQSRTIEDQDLKKITMEVGKMIADDLNNLKQSISISNKKLNMAIKQVSTESSQRSGQLSHYIDDQVKKVVDVVTQKYSKMKNVFTKIADQFKTHIQISEANKKNLTSRVTALEEDFQKLKNEMNQEMDEFYNDMEAKIKQEKQFVETVVFKKTNQLTLKVNKLQQYTNQYFEVLKSGIEDNKELLNNKMRDDKNGKNQESEQELKQLRSIIFEMKRLTEQNKAENTENYHKIDKEIQQLESKTKQTIVELTNSLNTKIIKNSEKNSENQQKINDLTVKVNSIRAESGSETAISSDRLKKISDEITEVKNKLAQSQQTQQKAISHTDEEIIKIKSDITVLKGQVGALDDDIKKLSATGAK